MKRFVAALGGVMMLAPAAWGQTDLSAIPGDSKPGYFIGIHGGATFAQDSDLSGSALTGVTEAEAELDTGFNVGGVLGYKFKNGARLETEYTYRRNDIDDISAFGVSASSAGIAVDGDIQAHSFMANAWYEPRLGGNWLPYVGGGLGVAIVDADITASIPGVAVSGSADDTVFAYQLGTGIGYEFTDNWVVSLDYRYWATSDPDFDGVEAEIDTHNIMVGLRAHFR